MNTGGIAYTCKSDRKWCFQWQTATLGLRHSLDSYGRQQWGIFRNGRKPDKAMLRGGRKPTSRELLFPEKKQ
ncbi:hypothetical protein HN873_008323 [Arachis hypogaea]